MTDYQALLDTLTQDPRYLTNLDWGKPRRGHPEGSIRSHIEELEQNLAVMSPRLSQIEIAKLKVLIHVHDTLKPDATAGVPIHHPRSHASLARAFLGEFCENFDLLSMVKYHDEPYALWQQVRSKGDCQVDRFDHLLAVIHDWDLFLAFLIIDGCTDGKGREPLLWFFHRLHGRVETRRTIADIM